MLPEPIRDREKIVEHLQAVLQAQIRFTVTFPGRRTEFLSQIVGVESPEHGRPSLVLDELTPSEGQWHAGREKMLRCAYRLVSTAWAFDAIIRGVRGQPSPGVVIAAPTEIGPNQLRRHYRVEPSISAPVEIMSLRIPSLNDEPPAVARRCVLVDIGLGGISFNTSVPRAHLDPGTRCPNLVLMLPGGTRIECSLIIRSVRPNPVGNYRHRVGAEFFMLEPHCRESLGHYVVEKQRADIKAIKREFA